jgi:hypothetical protein
MIINYKGETLETNHWCELSDETFKELKDAYYSKPAIEEVQKEMRAIARGGAEELAYN